ncbi:MAG TPA: hypothetical protein PLM07_05355 [Candidatus Rifleibacterium sp.]|nr:hypothetical protein [Candidatus Rifleibacterium sp.]HPT45308.1 hypothetical protein [Candidatus Rifleibacterium sp.]
MLSLLFCLVFPWSLLAEVPSAPQNSLTYFLESDSNGAADKAPEVVKAPEPSTEVAPASIVVERPFDRKAALDAMRARLATAEEPSAKETVSPAPEIAPAEPVAMMPDSQKPVQVTEGKVTTSVEKERPAKTVAVAKPVVNEPAVIEQPASEQPVKPAEIAVTEPAAAPESIQASSGEKDVPFAGVLARMQQNSNKRAAEAEKLGVVLPSQGGDIASVSPSLSKMQQAIRTIMTR